MTNKEISCTIAIAECPHSGQKVSINQMGDKFTVCYINGTHDCTRNQFDTFSNAMFAYQTFIEHFRENKEVVIMKDVQERFETLKSMNTIIKSMNDESAYSAWIYVVPDEADDDELREIAEEDEESFKEACNLFAKLVKKYMKYGMYIDGEVYGATE